MVRHVSKYGQETACLPKGSSFTWRSSKFPSVAKFAIRSRRLLQVRMTYLRLLLLGYILRFTLKAKRPPSFWYSLQDLTLFRTSITTDLGALFDGRLTFTPHFRTIKQRALRPSPPPPLQLQRIVGPVKLCKCNFFPIVLHKLVCGNKHSFIHSLN